MLRKANLKYNWINIISFCRKIKFNIENTFVVENFIFLWKIIENKVYLQILNHMIIKDYKQNKIITISEGLRQF